MQAHGKGILPSSQNYFYDVSEADKQLYFYPLAMGRYSCDENYLVTRQNYDSILLLYVIRGGGFVQQDGLRTDLKAGQFAFVDGYRPHIYGTETGWDITWLHFDGPMARRYYHRILQHSPGWQPANPDDAVRVLNQLYNSMESPRVPDNARISLYITRLLTEFLVDGRQTRLEGFSAIETVRVYISEHLDSQLSLNDLAQKANLSVYYFTRRFKKEVGCTPHEYIILSRVRIAKFYLKSTTASIKEISYHCGFPNECNFCTTFKRHTGFSPVEYRTSSETG